MRTLILSTWRRPGEVAIRAGWEARHGGADLLTTLEKGLSAAEFDESLIAIGRGSVPNSDGIIELDASIMDGRDLSSGAVAGVRDICPVISVARKVKEETPHAMLVGTVARDFAVGHGFEPCDLSTEDSRRRFEHWKKTGQTRIPDSGVAEEGGRVYVHTTDDKMGDTVTMLGWEEGGHVCAASSTSGLPFKLPGRVGDSPIVGAGIYADDEVGCAGATGNGEALWRDVASFRVVEAMRHGSTAQEACEMAIRHLARRQPDQVHIPAVVLAIHRDGDFGAAAMAGEFQLWICRDGEFEMREIWPIP